MAFQLGVYSFGNTPLEPNGTTGPTGQAIRDLIEAIQLAEAVGLDFFGIGEHHTLNMPVSSPTSVISAAAAVTHRIGLGSTVTVLSTDDPIRVYQQHATADALAPGRVEITAGRGSSVGSFPLFGYHLEDYDALYASKLDLLLAVNRQERVTWKGPFRDVPLEDALVVPRAERPLKIWLGTGGNPESSVRAGTLGLPVAYGILSGRAEQWAGMASLYREAGRRTGYDPAVLDVAVASHGFIAEDGDQARETFFQHEMAAMAAHAGARGTPRPGRSRLEANYGPGGMVFAGSPTEIARRLVDFQRVLGHSRQIIQMDLGHMPQAQVLRSIELLGTQVLPMVRDALA